MTETAYTHPCLPRGETPHSYGPNVHILSDAWAMSLLARLGHPDTGTMLLQELVEAGTRRLLHAATAELATAPIDVPTRMAATEPRARVTGNAVDASQRVVVVDVARAGMIPALVCQRELSYLIDPAHLRVDHVYMQRIADEHGRIVRVDLSGSKIGGPIDDATILVPDPMGATGGTVSRLVAHYLDTVGGKPRRFVALHLVITPEHIRRLRELPVPVHVYALRLDRGLSDPAVLETGLGDDIDRERGLTGHGYVVPGAGGLGELINNAFV
jgi:uracil phosphoribosyltransferase